MLKTAKEDYYREQLKLCHDNQIKFLKAVDAIIGVGKPVNIERVYHPGRNLPSDESETPDIINEFFATVAAEVTNRNIHTINEVSFNNFTHMKEDNLLRIIKEFSYNKWSSMDELKSKLVLEATEGIPDVLVSICNKSLDKGEFPNEVGQDSSRP